MNKIDNQLVMPKTIIVIGGLSAGPSAAAKARRQNENAQIILFEKTNHISYATCGIPYAFSGKIMDRDKLLVVKPELLERRFKIDVHLNDPVVAIDVINKTVTASSGQYQYDELIYAAGAYAFTPSIKGLNTYTNWAHAKSLDDFDRIIKSENFQNAKHVTVVGAGLIGLETAENLVERGLEVTVIERSKQVLGQWSDNFGFMAANILRDHGVDLKLGSSLIEISTNGELLLDTGESLNTDYLVMSIGVVPNTKLLVDQGVKTVSNGAIIVDEHMRSNIPNVYAAGDCAAIPDQITGGANWFPMGTHSNKAGRVAGGNAAGGNFLFKGGYGTAIMKLFDYTIARTGKTAKDLNGLKWDYETTTIIAGVTPGFYPGQEDLIVQIYYSSEDYKILGAEVIGKKGADKRIDVLATAIYAKLGISDLPNLDLAYAPPYSAAKDPVVVAGFVAENAQSGLFKELQPEDLELMKDLQIVDLRNPSELNSGKVGKSINIPLDQLRERISELDPQRPTLVYCAKGLRGYLGALILKHNRFNQVYNLAGGFGYYKRLKRIHYN